EENISELLPTTPRGTSNQSSQFRHPRDYPSAEPVSLSGQLRIFQRSRIDRHRCKVRVTERAASCDLRSFHGASHATKSVSFVLRISSDGSPPARNAARPRSFLISGVSQSSRASSASVPAFSNC